MRPLLLIVVAPALLLAATACGSAAVECVGDCQKEGPLVNERSLKAKEVTPPAGRADRAPAKRRESGPTPVKQRMLIVRWEPAPKAKARTIDVVDRSKAQRRDQAAAKQQRGLLTSAPLEPPAKAKQAKSRDTITLQGKSRYQKGARRLLAKKAPTRVDDRAAKAQRRQEAAAKQRGSKGWL